MFSLFNKIILRRNLIVETMLKKRPPGALLVSLAILKWQYKLLLLGRKSYYIGIFFFAHSLYYIIFALKKFLYYEFEYKLYYNK